MPTGMLYNDFGIGYIYARFKDKPNEGTSLSSTELPEGLKFLMVMQK